MSTSPDPDSEQPQRESPALSPTDLHEPAPPDEVHTWVADDARLPPAEEPPRESFFEHYASSQSAPPRFPNVMDLVIVGIVLLFGWLASAALTATALHFHLFGVTTEKQAVNDIHYTLGGQMVWYLVSFAGFAMIFPGVWNTGFLRGVEWRGAAAFRLRWRLFSAAFACVVLALVDGVLLPGPKEAPIDQVFRMPGAAWLLFAFGVTAAPFFEELIYRGLLLPALCTAWDWSVEHLQGRPAPWPDEEGKTRWSLPAMIAGSILTSVPFALMHGYQTAYSLGTFVLLMCVSLVLCWVRLSTRSLAASTLVHACYNFLLFLLMIAGTGGFKHLDKM